MERFLGKPKKNMVQSTIAFGKPPKKILVQSKLAFQIVITIHTKKKPTIDNEIEDTYDAIPKQIRDTVKKTHSTQKAKGKDKQKKKVQHRSHVSSGESRKRSKDTETFGAKFGIQMIADLETNGINLF